MEVTPFSVTGDIVYDKLVDQFGLQLISSELLARFEKVTGHKAHRFLRRGIFFAHRDLDKILDDFESGKKIFLYTGRGPSGDLHLGHVAPLEFTVYLQKALNAYVVFQMADDEKFYSKNLTLDQAINYGKENAKDVYALGFDPNKTFIFSNNEYKSNSSFKRICDELMKIVKIKDIEATFGITNDNNIGQLISTIYQMGASFSQSFPHLACIENFNQKLRCLIPCAVDQDVYFRISRDVAPKLDYLKPATIECKFLPSLEGNGKMSTTGSKTIFLTDTPKQIKDKINKYAFSGGQDTAEKHRQLGGDTSIDVAYQYLNYFLEDDLELARIKSEYESGKMLTGEIKKICISTLQNFITNHQKICQQIPI